MLKDRERFFLVFDSNESRQKNILQLYNSLLNRENAILNILHSNLEPNHTDYSPWSQACAIREFLFGFN